MKKVDIALVTWPKMSHRFESFKECTSRLQKMLKASSHQIRYFCSSELEGVPREAQIALKVFCRDNDITLNWQVEKRNLGKNMNRAIKLCSGEYIALFQDDMMLERECDLSPICDFLDANPKYALVRFDSTYTQFHRSVATLPDGTKMMDVDMNGRYPYQDEPHIRPNPWRFGWYVEGGAHGTASASINKFFTGRPGRFKIARTEPRYTKHGGIRSSMPERWG